MLCSGARVTSCGAASLWVSLRWCLVRGLLRRSCVTALGCVGGGLVRSCVSGCAGDGAGVWGRRELGSGAPATLSGLRRGCCVAGGGPWSWRGIVAGGRTLSRGPWAVALSRGWYVIGRGVAGGGPWCRRDADRRRWGSVRISRGKKREARRGARSAIKELAQTLHPRRTFICQRMCLPDLNWVAARKRWGGTSRWNRDRLMRSAFGGVVGAAALAASVVETAWCVASVVETRWAAAETPQGIRGITDPSGLFSAAYRRPARRVRPSGGACAALRAGWCPASRTNGGALVLCSAPPLWPSLGVAQCVAAAVGRSLLSDGMPRVSVPYSPTGLSGRALLTL